MVKSRAVKNPIEITRFWLLNEKETETFIKVLPFLNKSRKNNSYSEKNNSKSRNNDIKESKEKESKENNINTNVAQPYFINNELNEAFMQYLSMRQKNGNKLEEGQIKILRQNLLDISDNDIDRIAAAKSAYTSEWKNFYPDNKKGKQTGKNNINKFNNFNQRQYDYEQLERQILTSQLKNGV